MCAPSTLAGMVERMFELKEKALEAAVVALREVPHGPMSTSDLQYVLRKYEAAREPGPVVTPTRFELTHQECVEIIEQNVHDPDEDMDEMARDLQRIANKVLASRPQPAQPVVTPLQVTETMVKAYDKAWQNYCRGQVLKTEEGIRVALTAALAAAPRPQPAPSDAGAVVWTPELARRMREAYSDLTIGDEREVPDLTPAEAEYRAGLIVGLDKLSVSPAFADMVASERQWAHQAVELTRERDKLRAELAEVREHAAELQRELVGIRNTENRELTEAREASEKLRREADLLRIERDQLRSANLGMTDNREKLEAAEARVAELQETQRKFGKLQNDLIDRALAAESALAKLREGVQENIAWLRCVSPSRQNLARDIAVTHGAYEQADMAIAHMRDVMEAMAKHFESALAAAPAPVEAPKPEPAKPDELADPDILTWLAAHARPELAELRAQVGRHERALRRLCTPMWNVYFLEEHAEEIADILEGKEPA